MIPTERAVALMFSAWLTATACGGASFSGRDPAGGSGSTSAGNGGEAAGPSEGGQAGDGGEFSGAGDTASSSAGESPQGGAGGAGGVARACAELGGHEFSAHCYVDITTNSVAYAEAVAACANLASEAFRPGQLLVLDSVEEQAFVLLQFLGEFTDRSDAWLGLTCDSTQYPEFTSCYCTNCDASQRVQKRAAWEWLDGSKGDFGWVGQNPDGAGRCAAFAYNPSNFTWGWVDRNCTKTTHQLTGYPAHDYRTICELE